MGLYFCKALHQFSHAFPVDLLAFVGSLQNLPPPPLQIIAFVCYSALQ